MGALMKVGAWARDKFRATQGFFRSQRQTAAWLTEHATDGPVVPPESPAPMERRPLRAVADNDVLAHAVSRVRRLARRRQKKLGRLRKREQEVHKDRGDAPRWLRHIEPFVTCFPVFMATVLAGGVVLEASGTTPSLRIWSVTLGGSWVTYVMAAALGFVLTILGGFAGYLIELASRARHVVGRYATLTVACLIIAISALTIFMTSRDRDINLRSSAALTQASLLTSEAATLNRQALEDEARAAALVGKHVPTVASAEAKRLRASQLLSEADNLTTKAYQDRRLRFFAFAQLAALALSVVGGWAFAACAPLRLNRRIETLKASVKAIEQRAWSILLEIVAIGARSFNVAVNRATPAAEYDNSHVAQRAKDLYELIIDPPELNPSSFRTYRQTTNGSGDTSQIAQVN